jgi:hypothetical protein
MQQQPFEAVPECVMIHLEGGVTFHIPVVGGWPGDLLEHLIWASETSQVLSPAKTLQYAVPQFAEFTIHEMLAPEERQWGSPAVPHFAAGLH